MSLRALHPIQGEQGLHWRGREVSRVESLSDIVFGFALTLLVVSATPPSDFAQLRALLWEFPGFAAAFALLLLIWNGHYLFYRRYGLQDAVTIALNATLLFSILFFIYPLKFLASMFSSWIARLMGHEATALSAFSAADGQMALLWFSIGYAGLFALIAALYLYAIGKAQALELDARELRAAKASAAEHVSHAVIGATAAVGAATLPVGYAPFSGFIYFLVGPLIGLCHAWFGDPRRDKTNKEDARVHAD